MCDTALVNDEPLTDNRSEADTTPSKRKNRSPRAIREMRRIPLHIADRQELGRGARSVIPLGWEATSS